MNEKKNDIIEAIETALGRKFNGELFQKHLLNSKNRKHSTIEAFQKCLAATLSSNCKKNCKKNCQECKYIVTTKPENGCEYKLYQNYWEEVNDRADIRRENIIFDGNNYELIIEIDATRADQVAKKMMSRFCYAIQKSKKNDNRPIVYVALLYQGTKSMNSDECKKYFKMGYELLKNINISNILIGYIVDNEYINKNTYYILKEKEESRECDQNSIVFNDYKTFDSNLYRRYLEDNGVQSLDSIECYMLPLNTIHKCPSKAIVIQKNIIKSKSFNDYKEKLPEMNKNQLSYWRKYYKYLNDKKIELGLDNENNL